MTYIHALMALLVAAIVTMGLLPAIIRWAPHLGAVDRPGGRRVHRGSVPRLGGVAIVLGLGTGVATALITAQRVQTLSQAEQYSWYGPALGMVVVFIGGVLDDVFQYSARTKLAIQVVACSLAVIGGTTIDAVSLPGLGTVGLGVLGPIAAFAWILAVTNAINLIDGLDGLAGGLAFIVAVTIAAIAALNGQFAMVVCSFALAGALLGFLVFNFNPASVFMGDGGSQFLGFFIAVIALRGSQKGPTVIAITVPLLLLGLPLLDMATTIARRAGRETATSGWSVGALIRRVSRADREHLHHNLLDQGLSPRRAVIALYLVAVMFALSAYLSVATKSLPVALLSLCLSVGCVAAIKVRHAAVRRSNPTA